ncbi:hypothetical protein [Streptomyces bobili]
MTDALTLIDFAVPMRALRLLAVDFPHLPAPHVHLSAAFTEQLDVSLHDELLTRESFAAFEVWRAALGIAPDAVTFHVQSDGRTRVLRAACEFGGADVTLTAYATAPQAAVGRTGGAT